LGFGERKTGRDRSKGEVYPCGMKKTETAKATATVSVKADGTARGWALVLAFYEILGEGF
jgi:hypothetical protein